MKGKNEVNGKKERTEVGKNKKQKGNKKRLVGFCT
jgi:hypothetical protein